MQKVITFQLLTVAVFLIIIVVYSCSKSGGGGTPPAPCAGVTITVTGTTTNPITAGTATGSIVASASGSTGITYNINGGAFQSSGTFAGLVAGNYTISAKNSNGCSGSSMFTLTDPANTCTGVAITVNTTATGNAPCEPANGTLSITVNGGTSPYQYKINNGSYQSSNAFANLAAGNYTIFAKDANNCEGSSIVSISNLPAGTLFSAVKAVLQNNCVSCHNNTQSEGGMNWTVDCNIVSFKDRIQARAVAGNPSSMPPTGLLPVSERQKITDWINAGGGYTN